MQSLFREHSNECLDGNRVSEDSLLGGAAFMGSCSDSTSHTWILTPEAEFGSIPDTEEASRPEAGDPDVTPAVSGFEVGQVTYAGGGQFLGNFYETGPGEWTEFVGFDGQIVWDFIEVNRDEWSVYLTDPSRDVSIQLDLYRMKVVYSDSDERFDLYDIASATAVTGYTVRHAYYGEGGQQLGAFIQTDAQTWMETNAEGAFNFVELARDEWSVYLSDLSRGISVQVDLARKKVVLLPSDVRLRSVNFPQRYVRRRESSVEISELASAADFDDATFRKVTGLAGEGTISFESVLLPGYFLRHQSFALHLHQNDSSSLFAEDASFFERAGLAGGNSRSFESINFPGYFVRHQNSIVSIQQNDSSPLFAQDASFDIVVVNENGSVDVYDVLDSESVNGYVAQQVYFGRGAERLGTYFLSGTNAWEETNAQGSFSFDEVGRDEWSVYLSDPSRGVTIQIDYFRKKIVYSDSQNAAFDLYDILGWDAVRESASGLEPGEIAIVGSTHKYTLEEFETQLASEGLELVNGSTLEKDQCTILYTNADADDISASAGVLSCNIALDDGGSTLTAKAIYGGCDVSELTDGVGSKCEVGVFTEEFRIRVSDSPPIYTEMTASGPNAGECTAVSREFTCLGASADVVSTSFKLEDKNGSGAGVGLHVGVGTRFSGGYEDGVISLSGTLKVGIGVSIDLSWNAEHDVRKLYRLGESAWLENEDEIIAVGNKTIAAFASLGGDVRDAGDSVVTELDNTGQEVIGFAEDVGGGVAEAYDEAEETLGTVADDVKTGAGAFVNGVGSVGNKVFSFFGG